MKTTHVLVAGFLMLSGLAIFSNMGRADKPVHATTKDAVAPVDPKTTVEILFSTSDGKKEWVEEVTKTFNAKKVVLSDGRVAKVKLLHMRSGESIEKILAGHEKPHIWSPVNKGWISRLNEGWQLRHKQDFIASSRPTARTALVIATWEPMARALGWPEKPIGWEEILAVAHDPRGWGAYGHPEWGTFKFGHAHPDYATSANLSLASLAYAKTGKRDGLTADDLRREDVKTALASMERQIVHYGESSNWLTEKMCTLGPSYLSAVPLYESSVTKANAKWPNKAFPLVAISPKEGTFFEEHPAGIVEAEWCGSIEKEAARLYLDFLCGPEGQARTGVAGFHPADEPLPKDAVALAPVSDDVFKRLQALWHQVKKKSTVYMVVDTSGSMNGEPMNAARKAAAGFLKRMESDDEVQVIAFSTNVRPLGHLGPIHEVGEPLIEKVNGLFAQGNTALYDALDLAMREVEEAKRTRTEPRLYGIVLLTDGRDTSSRTQKLDLLAKLPRREDTEATRIFTIGFGPEADRDLLREISERTNAVASAGDDPKTLEKIYLQISSYF